MLKGVHNSLISKGIHRGIPNETKIEIEEKNTQTDEPLQERTWRSFCLTTDKGAVIYFGQLFFSTILVGLCSVMLWKADGECSQSSSYINILSFLAGKLLSSVVQ